MQQKTALLIFANSASKEAQLKPFPKSEVFFKKLNMLAINKAKRSGLPYFVVNEHKQIGFTFGERFANALKGVFELGFDNVISIGNDSPELKIADILRAEKALEQNKTVVGPSKNGGFYLIGLNKNDFNYSTFKNLAWQTPKIYSSFISHLNTTSQSLLRLNSLKDINSYNDLKYFLNKFTQLHFTIQTLITSILKFNNLFNTTQSIVLKNWSCNIKHNKGSPIAA